MAADPNYASVSLLLHGDGANGSTTITDNSANPKTVTAGGNAQISTAQSKFGGSSLYFDGTGDYLSIPAHADFQFGTGAFTIEAWLYMTATPGAQGAQIFGRQEYGAGSDYVFLVKSDRTVTFYLSNAAANVATSTATVPLNTWCHVAVTRSGTTFYVFVDGVGASGTSALSTEVPYAVSYSIGADQNGDESNYTGHIDDLRITKGVARYTATFTPPAIAHPDGMGEVSGVIRDDTGALCARTVRIINRSTGALIASTTSNASTGAYALPTPTLDEVQRIVLDDSGGTLYNDIIDRVIPS